MNLSKPLTAGSVPLGIPYERKFWWPFGPRELSLAPETRDREPHIIIIGTRLKGKSSLVFNMAVHDIASNDRAVVVVNTKGDLVDFIYQWISDRPNAKQIQKRVLVVDPTCPDRSRGYNPLDIPLNGDWTAAAQAVVMGFKSIYAEQQGSQQPQWNAQTANILRNAVLLLMGCNRTLADLPQLLGDNDFRNILLQTLEKRKDLEFASVMHSWRQYKKLAARKSGLPGWNRYSTEFLLCSAMKG